MDYQLGPQKQYTLSQGALNHIISGDISERQDKDPAGNTILTKIIAGGLHTFSAWETYRNLRPGIPHGLLVDAAHPTNWYYARELQNGVILLKIPRECFQSKAANLTKFPETYYKSGYLWKTLFPSTYDKDAIVAAIDEALHNLDAAESADGILIGYTNPTDMFKALKVRVQVRGTEILSAFPTWHQPMTGNNGKPFSHIDAINTVIARSSLFAGNDKAKYVTGTLGKWSLDSLNELYAATPPLISTRKPPKKDAPREQQLLAWRAKLATHGQAMSRAEVVSVFTLLTSDEYLRNIFDFSKFLYATSYKVIKPNLKLRNTASLFENFKDFLFLLSAWDKVNSHDYAFQAIKLLLKTRFIRTGGLDQWEVKRLSAVVAEVTLSYESATYSLEFLQLLSISPLRIGFYVEFNLNPFFVKSPALIGITGNKPVPLSDKHFYTFVAQNLGINYTANFADDFNLELAKTLQNHDQTHGLAIIKDSLVYTLGSDFQYFSGILLEVVNSIPINVQTVAVVDTIVYDYHRCIAASIQRVIAKHKDLLIQDLDFGDPDFTKFTKAKHEYKFLWVLNKTLIEGLAELYRAQGFETQATEMESKYLSLYEEVQKIPMPEAVPRYLRGDEELVFTSPDPSS